MRNARAVLLDVSVGEPVWDIVYGKGVVLNVYNEEIGVDFEKGPIRWYFKDGVCIDGAKTRSLYTMDVEEVVVKQSEVV